jgi:hypothetical protein
VNILGIDPGNVQSAIVLYNTETKTIDMARIQKNEELAGALVYFQHTKIKPYIEMIASYGMAVGKEVFNTCVWIGRFLQILEINEPELIYRKDVKLTLCNSMRAKDTNIRQACIDILGKEKTKGIKKDMWSALAICLTVASNFAENRSTIEKKV